jgi:cytochrome P450
VRQRFLTQSELQELLYELARRPLVQQKLREDLVTFEQQNGGPPSFKDLSSSGTDKLQYLDAVLKETLRCKAPIMVISRQVISQT